MNDSRIPGLYQMQVADRIAALKARGWLTADQAARLLGGRTVLSSERADRLIENVVGVFGLPFAIAPNFIVNNRDFMVPLVVEEPSVVAAVSGAARLARNRGGFEARCEESLLVGQVHVTGVADAAAGLQALESRRQELLDAANEVHPRLAARGGGVREVDFARLELPDGSPLIRVHLLVDTADAMGANLVNTICEAIAPKIETLCGGKVALRILSNLADRSIVTARVRFSSDDLAEGEITGEAIRDGIVMASDIASIDPYRAATHNKGIMNGIDAVAIATGNDWRAIEAGAHAYAAARGRYRPLTRWHVDDKGDLAGEISIPLKTGTVGGTLESNPAAALGLSVTGARSARELALLMAAVGLAQNFGALRALAGAGIQRGHMKLHARSVVAAVGAPEELFDEVVSRLVRDGEIKRWRAQQILDHLAATSAAAREPDGSAAGKVILFGEHAVVYGRHALALPLADAVRVYAEPARGATTLSVPAWGIAGEVDLDSPDGVGAAVALILRRLHLADSGFSLVVESALPRAMGLGSSAAIAVAVTRAISSVAGLTLDDERVNAIAFDCEKLAHGTPSGVDNTIATYARPIVFCNDGQLRVKTLTLSEPPPIVIARSHEAGLTSVEVAGVRARYNRAPEQYERLFDEIDRLCLSGADLLKAQKYEELGLQMNICHGLLSALEVSTPELDNMVSVARQAGAAGAKLTGAGGGGSIVAICPENAGAVRDALEQAGYPTLSSER